MKKVELSMKKEEEYEIIKNLVDHDGNKKRAKDKLGYSMRTLNRRIIAYKARGKEAFVHGNTGRTPANKVPKETKDKILERYKETYDGTNFTHYTELLEQHEEISVSTTLVASVLEADGIVSPFASHNKKEQVKKQLKKKQEEATTKKEKEKIEQKLLLVEHPHSRRPRSAYFGELVQMDASLHHWFGENKTTLHIGIDDCTGTITGAWFDKEETLDGYYHVTEQMLLNFGIPASILTDRRTVFTYKQKKSPTIDEDTLTQYGYACQQLGIELKTCSIPQVKGRVERLLESLQSRLPIELKLAGVTTITEANEFLSHYVKEYNKKFAHAIDYINSRFDPQLTSEQINTILAVLSERTVDCGQCIQYKNHCYRLLDSRGVQLNYRSGTKVVVIRTLDKQLFGCVEGKYMCALEEVPVRAAKSKNFDFDYKRSTPVPRNIPAIKSQWDRKEFRKFIRNQKHHEDDLEYMFDDLNKA